MLWSPGRARERPPCEQAQSDGVPCPDVGRDCEVCEAALAVELVGWKRDSLVVHTIPYGFGWDAEGIAPAWVPESVRAGAHEAGVEVGLGDPLISPWYQAGIRVQKVITGSDAGAYSVVPDLQFSDFVKEKIAITQQELRNEKSLVMDLLS